ncbi:MAG: adenosine kinase [Heterodermia speciosa]|uniref:Adenosine kinase n=1 Tax=Heterodermia speciosa TaxID=116794 RepID=A0A8H3IKU7_9LECA|nr:MAG: adenosine kinase [Heterodermia speciosa]
MGSQEQYTLLCLENPLLGNSMPSMTPLPQYLTNIASTDIQGKGDEAMLQKYGLKPNDAILAEEKHMGLYEDLIQNHDAKLIAGGAAQNTARGAQYILPPSSVLYIGCVGDDHYASLLTDACNAAGLRTEYLRSPKNSPTGRCGVIITGQDRSMCTHLAAANDYELSHLKSAPVWSLVQAAKFYYVGGYHLTVCPEAVLTLGKEAAEKDKVFMLSLSAPFIPQFFKSQVDETAPYWDYVVGNETEVRTWAQVHDDVEEKEDVKVIARKLAELPKVNGKRKRVVIVTQGTEETVIAVQGEESVREFKVHVVGQEEIYDTNGAGDAFAGGFIAGIVEGKSLEESVDRGHWLASLSIKELGPS